MITRGVCQDCDAWNPKRQPNVSHKQSVVVVLPRLFGDRQDIFGHISCRTKTAIHSHNPPLHDIFGHVSCRFSVAFSVAFHVAFSAASDVVVGGLVYAKQVHDPEVAFQNAIAIHRVSSSIISLGFLNASVICQGSFRMFCKVMGQA